MRTLFASLVLATVSLALPVTARAQESKPATTSRSYAAGGNFGLGLILGSPTGISGKFYLAPNAAIDAALGIGIGEDIHLHVDYLFEGSDVAKQPGFRLGWFAGIGARLADTDDEDFTHNHGNGVRHRHDHDELDFGPRVPVGLEFRVDELRQLEVFAEVALGIDLIEDTGLTIDAGIGARYFF